MIGTIGKTELKKVLSVEKGNIDKPVVSGDRVVAFTIEGDSGSKIKILLKNRIARIVYETFLKDSKTKDSTIEKNNVTIDKAVFVCFDSADIREIRSNKEVVCQNPVNLRFIFDYIIN